MSTTYKWADGYDNDGTAVALSPQPLSHGLQYEVTDALTGREVLLGQPWVELRFEDAITAAAFSALNTAFGVSRATRSNQGTLILPDDDDARGEMALNGTVHYPRGEYKDGFWRNVVYDVRDLRELTT